MTEQLGNLLAIYLGELMHQRDNTFDWIEKDKVTAKINAVNVLLDIDHKEKTWFQKVAEELKELKKIK